MAECKDIDRALAELSRKIDIQNACCESNKKAIADLSNRVKRLENRIGKPEERTQGKNDKQDLTAIYQRLSKLESYCLSIERLFKQIEDVVKPIVSIFKI